MAEIPGQQRIRDAARSAAPWVERAARAGYVAHGIIYLLVALLAARAALERTSPAGAREAMGEVERQPGGDWMLLLLAAGLAGFALWRFVQAALDPERKGSDAKGMVLRGRYVVTGFIYGGLALSAYRLGTGRSGGGGTGGWLSTHPSGAGRLLLGAVALGFVGYGLYQLYRAYQVDLDDQLELSRLSAGARTWVIRSARAGIAARGVVFGIIGVMLGRLAMREPESEAPGIQGALRTLQEQPYGKYLLLIVALGLAGYGVYELVRARYRRIDPA
jgi:hypothetical protein